MNKDTLDVEFESDDKWKYDLEYVTTLSTAEGWRTNSSPEEIKEAREKMKSQYGIVYSLDDDLPDPEEI